MRAAQKYAREGKDWVVDMDITKFFDHVKSFSKCFNRTSISSANASYSAQAREFER